MKITRYFSRFRVFGWPPLSFIPSTGVTSQHQRFAYEKVKRHLRILFVCNRIEKSETKDSIYGHVGPCIGHTHVNRLDEFRKRTTSFVILAFGCCHAILIGLERRLRIGGPNRMGIKVSLCAERNDSEKSFERNGCARAAECSDIVSITWLTITEFSFNDSSAFLLSIRLNRK